MTENLDLSPILKKKSVCLYTHIHNCTGRGLTCHRGLFYMKVSWLIGPGYLLMKEKEMS